MMACPSCNETACEGQPICGLKYIARSPSAEHGGFHEEAIRTAKLALELIYKLQGRLRMAEETERATVEPTIPIVVDRVDGSSESFGIRRFRVERAGVYTAEYWNLGKWQAFCYVFKDRRLAESICDLLLAARAGAGPSAGTPEREELLQPRFKYFPLPLEFREPKTDNEAATIYDAKGSTVAMLFWPTHPAEETEAAEQETYALGRLFASALGSVLPATPTKEK